MDTLISIVIPVYNAEKTLKRCVDSVLAQTYSSFEIILVDDGSEDAGGAMCDAYAQKDPRIKVLHKANGGVSSARNAGIAAAAGTYLFLLDSDDWILPETLSVYVRKVREYGSDAVIGGLTVWEEGKLPREDSEGREIHYGADVWEALCIDSRRFGYAGGKMIRSAIVQQNAIRFHEKMTSQEDADFLLSVYAHCSRICVMDFSGYQYEYVPGKRNPPVWDFIQNQIKLLRIAEKKGVVSPEAMANVHRRIASLLFSGLYNAAAMDTYGEMVSNIAGVSGITEVLVNLTVGGEHGFVARMFAERKYRKLYRYFKLRHFVRKMVRKIRK